MDVKECNSLEEVRDEVDIIDDKIVDLIAQRNALIRQAASFKQSVEEVKAKDRVDSIIARLRHRALQNGLSANLIEELYTKMIEEMVETEIAEFRNKNSF